MGRHGKKQTTRETPPAALPAAPSVAVEPPKATTAQKWFLGVTIALQAAWLLFLFILAQEG